MELYNGIRTRFKGLATDASIRPTCLPLRWLINSTNSPSQHLLSPIYKRYTSSDSSKTLKVSPRKQVTVRNDDGRVQWKELTLREKAARTTQQTFNVGVILAGLVGTVRSLQPPCHLAIDPE